MAQEEDEEEEEEEGVRQNDNSDTDHGQKRGYSDCYRASSFAWFRWWYSANARKGVASFVLV